MSDLTAAVVPKSFTASQEELFAKALEDLDRHSVMWPMSRPEDICLNGRAEIANTAGGNTFKLTNLALYQLCQSVCPGLYGFIREMSGVHRTVEECRGDYSLEECVDIINRVVRLRFDTRLHGKVLLRNTKFGTIDGVLTPGYKWLSNLRLYEMTREAMKQCDTKPIFWEAQLNGRWLLLRYCHSQPYFTIKLPGLNVGSQETLSEITERFYAGYHFSNDELGRATVRGTHFLLRKDGHTAALSSLDVKGRVRHSGGSFEDRLKQLLNRTITHIPTADRCCAATASLLDLPLGLGHKLHKEEVQARQKLANKLCKKDIPITVSKKIVASLCSHPSCLTPDVVEFRSMDRNQFDLYTAIGREAKHLPIRLREATEQLAYELLFNKITLN